MSIAFHRNKKNGQLFLFVVHPRGQQTPKAWALVLYAVYYIVQLGLTIYTKLFFFNSKKRFKRKISIRKLLLSPLSRSVENKTCIAFKRPASLWWWSSRRFGQLKQSPPFFACVSVCLYTTQMLREREQQQQVMYGKEQPSRLHLLQVLLRVGTIVRYSMKTSS
jgi:hypothetical protein